MRSLDKRKLRRWFTDGAARTRPPMSDASTEIEKLIRAWTLYRAQFHASEPAARTWPGAALSERGVERLAKALYRRRYPSPRAVKQVLGDAFFAGLQPDKRNAAITRVS